MRLLSLLVLILLIFSCKEKRLKPENKNIDYYFMEYREFPENPGKRKLDSIPYENYQESENGEIKAWGIDKIVVNHNEYLIKRYLNRGESKYAEEEFFYVDSLGLLFRRNMNTGAYRKLHSTNDSVNNVINNLLGFILSNRSLYAPIIEIKSPDNHCP